MIALILALIFHPQPWCMALPAQHIVPPDAYLLAGDFVGRTDDARLWSTQPISATITVSDTVTMGTLSLYESMALGAQDGAFHSQSDSPYTVYLCSSDTRPRVLYFPMLHT